MTLSPRFMEAIFSLCFDRISPKIIDIPLKIKNKRNNLSKLLDLAAVSSPFTDFRGL